MKITTAAAMILIVASTSLNAQEAQERPYFSSASMYANMDRARLAKGYLNSLSSDNTGVVESALAHVAMMKLILPASNFKAIERKVTEIAVTADAIETRYKAFLTKAVFDEPAMFSHIPEGRYDSADEFFGTLASRMSTPIAER